MALAVVLPGRPASAQEELQASDTPLTAWLDLRPAAPGAEPQSTPTWVEAFEFIPAKGAPETADAAAAAEPAPAAVPAENSIFRIRVQRPAAAVHDLQVRIFFEDRAGDGRLGFSVWNELGTELMRSTPLGHGLGLPSSETLDVPMDGVDYLEISAPGDGSQVRAVFLSWLKKSSVLQPADFAPAQRVSEPFHILAATHAPKADAYLYGVVTARLRGKPLLLKPAESSSASFEFQLERQPLLAVVSYEILGAAVGAAPAVTVNGQALGNSEVYLPDLADPGYRGETRDGDTRMTFRYTGWVHAQKVIPADALTAGLNNLAVALSDDSSAVAIRSVQIQLKYNWEKLDYILSLTPVPDEAQ